MVLSKKIIFENFTVCIIDECYYEIEVNEKNDFTINDLKLLVAHQKEIGEQILPVLILCNEHSNTNIELLNYIAKNLNNPYSKVDAFIIKSLPQKILANFYIKMNKPERPTLFFTTKDDALEWLKTYF